MQVNVEASGRGEKAHVEIEELEKALVREDVEHVAGGAVDDRQPVHTVLDQHAHRLQERLVRRDRYERLVARQLVCTYAKAHTREYTSTRRKVMCLPIFSNIIINNSS